MKSSEVLKTEKSEELVEKVLIKKLGGDESNKNNSGVNNESN